MMVAERTTPEATGLAAGILEAGLLYIAGIRLGAAIHYLKPAQLLPLSVAPKAAEWVAVRAGTTAIVDTRKCGALAKGGRLRHHFRETREKECDEQGSHHRAREAVYSVWHQTGSAI